MSRRRIAIYILGAIVGVFILYKLVTLVFGFFGGGKAQGVPPAPVEVTKAIQQQWQDQVHTTGTISAMQGVMISPQVAGTITKIYFTSGSEVKAGDPLFQIFPSILEAQQANDQAALTLAQVNYNRAVALYQKHVISQEQLDSNTATLQQAQANLDQTKAQLVQHNIVAPFSGRIGLKMVDEGNFVNVGQNLVSLQQMNPLRIDFNVPDIYIGKLKASDKVEVTPSNAEDNTVYVGSVYAFNSMVDPSTRSFSMWAKIPNPDENLIPGTYVDLTLFYGKPHTVVTIPQTAALFSPQGEYAYTVVDGKAVKADITVGLRHDNWIEVTSGLKAGDTVVTAGQVKILFSGAPIVPMPTSTYPAEQPATINYVTFPNGVVPDDTADEPSSPSTATVPAASAQPTTVDTASQKN